MPWDIGGDEGGPARAGIDEGELLLATEDDAACAARALAAVGGHCSHVREGAGGAVLRGGVDAWSRWSGRERTEAGVGWRRGS